MDQAISSARNLVNEFANVGLKDRLQVKNLYLRKVHLLVGTDDFVVFRYMCS